MTPPNLPIESVWDYPRPPRLERTPSHIRIVHHGIVLADTTRALRILETSHPPVFYLPPADIAMKHLRPSTRRSSFCEFKGVATYWSIDIPRSITEPAFSNPGSTAAKPEDVGVAEDVAAAEDVAWSYSSPSPAYAPLRDHLAFYANRLAEIGAECSVDGEVVVPQPGDFYGGWITSRVTGPFKGPPGTRGW